MSAERCFALFCDAARLPSWVPGLRRATVIAVDGRALPSEVKFEFSTARTYFLTYTYDLVALEVSWAPRLGARDAVEGRAVFVPVAPQVCEVDYTLSFGAGRTEGENVLGDPVLLVNAFRTWATTLG